LTFLERLFLRAARLYGVMTLRRHYILSLLLTVSATVPILLLIRERAQHARTSHGPSDLAYKLTDGAYALDTFDQTLHDTKRNKDLPVRVLVPTLGGPFPVIVFSHGAGGSGQNYFPLTHHWATHGYVIIQPTHNDSIALRRERGDALPPNPRELAEEYRNNPDDWANRVRDITLVLDSLNDLQKSLPRLKGKIDQKRIGVGGHSYGAYTTQMIGGALLDIPNGARGQSFRDDRPRALLLLSPQGKTQNGLTEDSWKKMTRPMMVMTGSNDRGLMGQPVSWRTDPFIYSPAGDKYLVYIDGAFHMSFTGMLTQPNNRLGNRPLLARMIAQTDQQAVFDDVKIASIAFWDGFLKDDAKAKAYLKSDSLVQYSNKQVRLDRK
jgi:predicted dienelactone hydrolase